MTYREGVQLSRAIDNLRAAVNILEDLYFMGKGGYTTTDIEHCRTETYPKGTETYPKETETTCTD